MAGYFARRGARRDSAVMGLANGHLSVLSALSFRVLPSKLWLKAGEAITLDVALKVLIVVPTTDTEAR